MNLKIDLSDFIEGQKQFALIYVDPKAMKTVADVLEYISTKFQIVNFHAKASSGEAVLLYDGKWYIHPNQSSDIFTGLQSYVKLSTIPLQRSIKDDLQQLKQSNSTIYKNDHFSKEPSMGSSQLGKSKEETEMHLSALTSDVGNYMAIKKNYSGASSIVTASQNSESLNFAENDRGNLSDKDTNSAQSFHGETIDKSLHKFPFKRNSEFWNCQNEDKNSFEASLIIPNLESTNVRSESSEKDYCSTRISICDKDISSARSFPRETIDKSVQKFPLKRKTEHQDQQNEDDRTSKASHIITASDKANESSDFMENDSVSTNEYKSDKFVDSSQSMLMENECIPEPKLISRRKRKRKHNKSKKKEMKLIDAKMRYSEYKTDDYENPEKNILADSQKCTTFSDSEDDSRVIEPNANTASSSTLEDQRDKPMHQSLSFSENDIRNSNDSFASSTLKNGRYLSSVNPCSPSKDSPEINKIFLNLLNLEKRPFVKNFTCARFSKKLLKGVIPTIEQNGKNGDCSKKFEMTTGSVSVPVPVPVLEHPKISSTSYDGENFLQPNITYNESIPTVDITYNETSPIVDITYNETNPAVDITYNEFIPTVDITYNKTSPIVDITYNETSPTVDIIYNETSPAVDITCNETSPTVEDTRLNKEGCDSVTERTLVGNVGEETNYENAGFTGMKPPKKKRRNVQSIGMFLKAIRTCPTLNADKVTQCIASENNNIVPTKKEFLKSNYGIDELKNFNGDSCEIIDPNNGIYFNENMHHSDKKCIDEPISCDAKQIKETDQEPEMEPKKTKIQEFNKDRKGKIKYESFPILRTLPQVGDIIAVMLLSMDENMTPAYTNYQPAKVYNVDGLRLKLQFLDEPDATNSSSKHELNAFCVLDWRDLKLPRLMYP